MRKQRKQKHDSDILHGIVLPSSNVEENFHYDIRRDGSLLLNYMTENGPTMAEEMPRSSVKRLLKWLNRYAAEKTP